MSNLIYPSIDSLNPVKNPPWGKNVPTNITRAFLHNDPMEAYDEGNLYPPKTEIDVSPRYSGINRQSVVLNDVKLATKGDGTPRDVHVNDAKVPRRMVVDAMFRNQDFMPRTDQFPLIQNPLMVDENLKRQRSHFGPMKKQPLNLGFDVIRSNINTDITIAENGGRYEE